MEVITAVLTFRGEPRKTGFERTAHSYPITGAPRKLYFTKYLCYIAEFQRHLAVSRMGRGVYTWTGGQMDGQRERERFLSALRATMRLKLYGQTFSPPLPASFYFPLLNSSLWNKSVVHVALRYMQLSCMTFFSFLPFFSLSSSYKRRV